MVFPWGLSDNKSPQVSWTLLSILAVLTNAVVWIVSTRPPTPKSPSPFSNPLVTVPKAPITTGTIGTIMFHSFFNSLARSRYLSFFSHSFSFILWSAGTAKSTILQRSFFQAAVVSILLYGCTTWTLTKRLEKKLNGNYTRMLRAVLNKSWRQHPTRHQLYGHLPPITKTTQVRRTRHAGHFWRCKVELISDVLLWTPTYGCAKAGRPARTYIQQLCEDTGCNPEDLPEAMNDREKWRERVRDIRAGGTTWWWWWWWWL